MRRPQLLSQRISSLANSLEEHRSLVFRGRGGVHGCPTQLRQTFAVGWSRANSGVIDIPLLSAIFAAKGLNPQAAA